MGTLQKLYNEKLPQTWVGRFPTAGLVMDFSWPDDDVTKEITRLQSKWSKVQKEVEAIAKRDGEPPMEKVMEVVDNLTFYIIKKLATPTIEDSDDEIMSDVKGMLPKDKFWFLRDFNRANAPDLDADPEVP